MTRELIERVKCSKCKIYLGKNVVSDLCLECSKKRMFTPFPSLISGFAPPSLFKNAK